MSNAVQRRLLDRLRPDLSLTGPVRRVLATTHDLDAQFFDGDFSCTVLSVSQAEFTGASGQLALQRKLAALDYAGVLCEAAAFERRPNLRVAVHPVGLRGARLHAKLVVIEYERAVRLLVGSANLTHPGYRGNREVAGEYFATESSPLRAAATAATVRGALQCLAVFRDRSEEFLAELEGIAMRLEHWAQGARADSPIVWSDGTRPLYRELLARWPAADKVERLRVISPFWCEDGSSDTPLRRLLRELAERAALAERCAVELFVEGTPLASGAFAPKDPLCCYYGDFPGVSLRVIPVTPEIDPADLDVKLQLTESRRLHAKILVLESARHALAYAGSANFTRRGFGLRKAAADGSMAANIEAGWLFELSPSDVQGLLPPAANEGQLVPSLPEPGAASSTDEDETTRFWPSALLSAELEHSGDVETMVLVARFAATTPPGWVLRIPGELDTEGAGEELLATTGGEAAMRRPLSLRAFRALLRERHVLVCAPEGEALFPINVAAGEARDRLPLASGTAVPSESELLDYYQGRLTFEDLFVDAGAVRAASAASEPSGGIDKSRIQAYRLRAFVDALPGIRNELRGVSGSSGVLYQAFLGPVSPTAIANAIASEVTAGRRTATAGAFQLVELAALLDSLRTEPSAERGLYEEYRARARREIASVLDELRTRYAAELSATSAFARYEARICTEQRA